MGIEKWSTSAGSNNMAPPDGWPGGMLPSQVEPTGRQMMASIASWYQAAEWINYNFPIVYSSATVFTISTNATALYHVGRRVQATDGSTSVFGTITATAFTSLTTVTVVWDTGVLQTGVTIVYVGITSAVNTSAPAQTSLLSSNNTWTGANTFTPASGSAITVNATANNNGITVVGSATTGQSLGLLIRAGTTAADQALLVNNKANTANLLRINGDGSTVLGFNGTANVITTSAAGNVTIAPPTSGSSLAANVLDGSSVTFQGPNSSRGFQLAFFDTTNSAFRGFIGIGTGTVTGAATTDFAISPGAAGSVVIGNANGGAIATRFGPNGNIVVSAPSGGNTLSLNGAASGATLAISGSSTTGQSIGGIFQAGTSASDFGLEVISASGSFTQFKVRGDGVVFGNDGTNLLELGYKDVPLNVQSSNYQLTAADRGKAVQAGATITVTVPSGVFSGGAAITIFVGSGATVTIAQGAGMSLQWAGNGASTGSRTLTGAGMATILYASSGVALISGAGLT